MSWPKRVVVVVGVIGLAFFAFIAIKGVHHQFGHLPGIWACRRHDAMSIEATPNRGHGRMETFDLGNCTFFWWESHRGGD
jgi:hypothetical protein